MQVALVEMQRRVQSRVPLPWISAEDGWLRDQQAAGRALIRFGDIPLDWTDFRLTLRQTADILRRFDALEPADYTAIIDARARRQRARADRLGVVQRDVRRRAADKPEGPQGLEQVLVLALRPFLARSVEVLTQRVDLSAWGRAALPVLRVGTRVRGDRTERGPSV